MATNEFPQVFLRLSRILHAYQREMVVVDDDSQHIHLDTPHGMKNKKNFFFGGVRIMKNNVSYHLMPVYLFPQLLETASPALRSRMQGKSCFNFKSVDEGLFEELATLTEAGYQRYRKHSYV
ncbi:MAG: hypothetical protein CL569_02515 [Alphaproteobacteria bacterium]|nr:hypothetical protein [Alphaproteobacteria bacterium]|tara:strand:- start:9269 stop:9634 length:366 start_codon:yes stop_codon:yes gene_type:complete